MLKKGILSPLCPGSCCYTGHFLHLIEVFWLKFMFSPCIPCSPELLQSQALYKWLWINPCRTFVVRKHSFSHENGKTEEGALMIQKHEALAGGAAHETSSVLRSVCRPSQRVLGRAQEQNLHPRAVLSPPGPPSSVARPFLMIFFFLNHMPSLVFHHGIIRCVINGRTSPPQRSSTQFRACSREFSLCSLNQGDIYVLKHTAW